MPRRESQSFHELFQDWNEGDLDARDRVIALVYDELRVLARRHMRRERQGHTLQTTAVVNEAYLRLAAQRGPWQNRAHFLGVAARLMRRILIDHARARQAVVRGGQQQRVTLRGAEPAGEPPLDLLALDQALTRLAEIDPRQVRVVELRFFAGLTIEETAEVLGVSHTIVEREWAHARAWLRREMK